MDAHLVWLEELTKLVNNTINICLTNSKDFLYYVSFFKFL